MSGRGPSQTEGAVEQALYGAIAPRANYGASPRSILFESELFSAFFSPKHVAQLLRGGHSFSVQYCVCLGTASVYTVRHVQAS